MQNCKYTSISSICKQDFKQFILGAVRLVSPQSLIPMSDDQILITFHLMLNVPMSLPSNGMKSINQYDALIGDGRAGEEAPSCERGVHVRTCRCTPHLTCVSLSSNGSLAAHQVRTQSAQPFARCGRRVCTCARADALHLRHA